MKAILRTEIAHPDDLLNINLQNKNISVPDYLKDFVDYKIERWVTSAFQASFMREDGHFVLDLFKTDEQNNQSWTIFNPVELRFDSIFRIKISKKDLRWKFKIRLFSNDIKNVFIWINGNIRIRKFSKFLIGFVLSSIYRSIHFQKEILF